MRILSSTDQPVTSAPTIQPILITGGHGTLGRAFQRICHTRGIEAVALGRNEIDIANPASVEKALDRYNPWAIINTAGYVRVDDAEKDFARCYRENTTGPIVLAQACCRRHVQLLTYSSDLVFDGAKAEAYLEGDQPRPLNVYGKSKQQAEAGVLEQLPQALVVRTSAFFGAWDEYNFVYFALKAAHEGRPFEAAGDLVISPTYVPDLVNTSLDLLIDEERGVWHLANEGAFTWAELAELAVGIAGLDRSGVVARPARHFGWPAARPAYSVLGSQAGRLMPTAESGLHRCVHDIMHQLRTRPVEAEAVAS